MIFNGINVNAQPSRFHLKQNNTGFYGNHQWLHELTSIKIRNKVNIFQCNLKHEEYVAPLCSLVVFKLYILALAY